MLDNTTWARREHNETMELTVTDSSWHRGIYTERPINVVNYIDRSEQTVEKCCREMCNKGFVSCCYIGRLNSGS